MAAPVKILVAGLPAELVREIGLRLRDVAVSEFENAQQMGRAAAHAETGLVILSDALPTSDAIYVARRARDASDEMKIAFCISMQQAENASFLESPTFHPERYTLMVDYTPSEFSRIRLQWAQSKTQQGVTDNELFLQYILTLGAHGAQGKSARIRALCTGSGGSEARQYRARQK